MQFWKCGEWKFLGLDRLSKDIALVITRYHVKCRSSSKYMVECIIVSFVPSVSLCYAYNTKP
jgi:hypothetical protein